MRLRLLCQGEIRVNPRISPFRNIKEEKKQTKKKSGEHYFTKQRRATRNYKEESNRNSGVEKYNN
jgi:cell fate (sporulation/competence/biofilm development) regulator YlbF (YheA/YmcA/DUF963 family)